MMAPSLAQANQFAMVPLRRVRASVSAPSSYIRWLSHTALRKSLRPRSTLSSLWVPTGLIVETPGETGHDKLVRTGFLRQAQSGIFHMLPLGVRVQEKLERLLDEHMQSIGASKVSMSSITSEDLWRKSGRLDKVSAELFRLRDRKDVPMMLGPTHEEEITSLVASTLKSYKDLPIKLYQTTRKYRDEIRPRHGLLRSREFIMKDLYTFDTSPELAIESYRQVSGAYKAMFERLKLPIIVAEASSGDMGGDHSHEYHLAHATGSDTVLTCDQCDYAANDEVAVSRASPAADPGTAKAGDIAVWRGVSKDRKTSVNVWYCKNEKASVASRQVNIHAVKSVYPEIDTAVTGQAALAQEASKDTEGQYQVLNIVDGTLAASYEQLVAPRILDECQGKEVQQTTVTKGPGGEGLNLLSLADGDGCPRCESGSLHIHRALELGHTFYLGTRYTKPFEAKVALPHSPKERVELEMGCYGIGVSRIFAAVAEHLVDEKGLSWPRIIAPFEAIIIPTSEVTEDTLGFYDMLTGVDGSRAGLDAVLDDRKQSFGRKMQDAEATGYPVSIILGKGWKDQGLIEVQCRRLGVKKKVPVADVVPYLDTLLSKL